MMKLLRLAHRCMGLDTFGSLGALGPSEYENSCVVLKRAHQKTSTTGASETNEPSRALKSVVYDLQGKRKIEFQGFDLQ